MLGTMWFSVFSMGSGENKVEKMMIVQSGCFVYPGGMLVGFLVGSVSFIWDCVSVFFWSECVSWSGLFVRVLSLHVNYFRCISSDCCIGATGVSCCWCCCCCWFSGISGVIGRQLLDVVEFSDCVDVLSDCADMLSVCADRLLACCCCWAFAAALADVFVSRLLGFLELRFFGGGAFEAHP